MSLHPEEASFTLHSVKQYRPNVDRQKWLYSMMKSREIMLRRRRAKQGRDASEVAAEKKRIPDNSEPWLPGGVRSVADAIWISDRIKETVKQWRIPLPPQS